MLNKISLAFLITSYFIVSSLQAQTTTKKDSSTVIIFNSGALPGGKKHRGSSENNIIKIEPLGFLFGKVPLSYERKITDLLSIQVSAGVTTKNYLSSLFTEALSDPDTRDDDNLIFKDANFPDGFVDQSESLHNFENRKAAVGYMFSVQPRVHFEDDGLEGSFLALSADFYKYNYTIPGLVQNGGEYKATGTTKNEYEKIRDVMVLFGYEQLYDHLTLGYTIGAGLRSVNGVKYVAGQSNIGFYESESVYTKKTGVAVGFSFKVGYHF